MKPVSATLAAELLITRGQDCPSGTSDPATVFQPDLLPVNKALFGADIGQKVMTINSPAAFVTLAYPGNLGARVVYFRPLTGSFSGIRLTHAGVGAVAYPTNGLFLAEFPESEQVEAIEVKGEGTFEWVAWGVLA